MEIRDYFTPSNEAHLNATDGDFGSGAPVLLPDQPGLHPHLLLAAGKAGLIYELDRDNLGQFNKQNDSRAVQVVKGGTDSFGAPAYWKWPRLLFAERRHVARLSPGERAAVG